MTSSASAADGTGVDSVVCSEYERRRVEFEDRRAFVDVARRELQALGGDIDPGVAAVVSRRTNADRVGRLDRGGVGRRPPEEKDERHQQVGRVARDCVRHPQALADVPPVHDGPAEQPGGDDHHGERSHVRVGDHEPRPVGV